MLTIMMIPSEYFQCQMLFSLPMFSSVKSLNLQWSKETLFGDFSVHTRTTIILDMMTMMNITLKLMIVLTLYESSICWSSSKIMAPYAKDHWFKNGWIFWPSLLKISLERKQKPTLYIQVRSRFSHKSSKELPALENVTVKAQCTVNILT